MSAQSDLIVTHSDSPIFTAFEQLPEFENLSRELFSSNALQEDETFLEELESKDDLKDIPMIPELASFNEAQHMCKEDINPPKTQLGTPFPTFLNGHSGHSMEPVLVPIDPVAKALSASSMFCKKDDMASSGNRIMGLASIINAAMSSDYEGKRNNVSPNAALSTASKMDSMHLGEVEIGKLCSSVAPSPFTSAGQVSTARELINSLTQASSAVKTTPIVSPSVLQINSLSSPPSALKGASLFKEVPGHEENINLQLLIPSLLQADLSSSSSCSTRMCSMQMPQVEASMDGSNGITALCDTTQASSHAPSIQRSLSTHALDHIKGSGYPSARCPEDFTATSSEFQMAMLGLSSLSCRNPFQTSNSHVSVDRTSPLPAASMRRVYSTGDLQMNYGGNCNINMEQSYVEEGGGLKIGHYTLEQRKVRLHRYRQKRNERNFNKKIKYACRKTLADSRPRIRGRFARTDDKETGTCHDEEYEEADGGLLMLNHTFRETDGLLMVNDKYHMCSTSPGAGFWNSIEMKACHLANTM